MKLKTVSIGLRTAALAVVALLGVFVATNASANPGQSFLFLQPGFTQSIFGVSQSFMGGVAFAPDGDAWVDECQPSGSPLHRYDLQSTTVVNGTTIHPETIVASNAGCGLVNHPNGSMYSNLLSSSGVVKLNANTGAQTGGPFGPAGRGLGIAVDPNTANLDYVGINSDILFVNPALTTSGTFSTVTTGNFVDGIAWDPAGGFLFLSNRSPSFRLTILNSSGGLVQHVPMTSEPDGIAFHGTTPVFVVTNNTDGTMTRFDFPSNDFTMVPVQTVFASGGFRGDLSQVGPDGCDYVTQNGTRYDNGVTTSENSLVRICGGFAPGPGVSMPTTVTLSPLTATNPVSTSHTVTATVDDQNGNPMGGVTVHFTVTGSVMTSGTCVTTLPSGSCSFTYQGPILPGADTIKGCAGANGAPPCGAATKVWVLPQSSPLCTIDITQGGWMIANNGDKVSFGGTVHTDQASAPSGQEQYTDKPAMLNVHSINILAITCSANLELADIYGTATINGSGSFNFRIEVTDPDSSNGNDTYWIVLANGYNSGSHPLGGGHVEIHHT